ncbi:MAG: hypothetical protein ACHP6H_06615 [Legionellales bacterium]
MKKPEHRNDYNQTDKNNGTEQRRGAKTKSFGEYCLDSYKTFLENICEKPGRVYFIIIRHY